MRTARFIGSGGHVEWFYGDPYFQGLKPLLDTHGLSVEPFAYRPGQTPDGPPAEIAFWVNEVPDGPAAAQAAARRHLLFLYEPHVVMPRIWQPRLHEAFDLVFTWDDALVDGKRYHKFNYLVDRDNGALAAFRTARTQPKERPFALINAHKLSHEPGELYSERIRVVEWFECHAPGDFDLYGPWWDQPVHVLTPPKGKAAKRLARWKARLGRFVPSLRPQAPNYASYRGKVDDKHSALARTRFCFAYENADDRAGYLTEKIFDAFAAACVPIYLGATNVERTIPPACFVDARDFASIGALVDHCRAMRQTDYEAHRDAIEAFLGSPAFEPPARLSGSYFLESVPSRPYRAALRHNFQRLPNGSGRPSSVAPA